MTHRICRLVQAFYSAFSMIVAIYLQNVHISYNCNQFLGSVGGSYLFGRRKGLFSFWHFNFMGQRWLADANWQIIRPYGFICVQKTLTAPVYRLFIAVTIWWSGSLSVDEVGHMQAPLLQFVIGLSYGKIVLMVLSHCFEWLFYRKFQKISGKIF